MNHPTDRLMTTSAGLMIICVCCQFQSNGLKSCRHNKSKEQQQENNHDQDDLCAGTHGLNHLYSRKGAQVFPLSELGYLQYPCHISKRKTSARRDNLMPSLIKILYIFSLDALIVNFFYIGSLHSGCSLMRQDMYGCGHNPFLDFFCDFA